jgi:hypothetical protein
MAYVSHSPGDLSGHPDAPEMRERYARMTNSRSGSLAGGPVLLAGLWTAISPWVVHFAGHNPNLRVNNLIVGIAIACIGLIIAQSSKAMHGLTSALVLLGAWLIVSPWLATRFPDRGMMWNNIITGAVVCLLGLVATGAMMRSGRKATRSTTTHTTTIR